MSTGAVDDVGVPSAERQAWLLEQTRLLVAAVGAEPLLRAPQLEPTPAFFPDGWSPDVEGAAALTRRLLDFAHLEHLDLALVRFLNETDPDSEEGGRHAVGFFQGIESAVCHFGIHLHALTDPEKVVGVMAHEVAHAFRHLTSQIAHGVSRIETSSTYRTDSGGVSDTARLPTYH